MTMPITSVKIEVKTMLCPFVCWGLTVYCTIRLIDLHSISEIGDRPDNEGWQDDEDHVYPFVVGWKWG
jgi:hypothetical protein